MESIKELRAICQPAANKRSLKFYMGSIARFVSIYLTRWILQRPSLTRLAGLVTLLTGMLACLFFLFAQALTFFIGMILLHFWYVLGCAASEIRLYRGHQSDHEKLPEKPDFGLTGIYCESIHQYIIHLLVPLSISYGLFNYSNQSSWFIVGMMASVTQILLLCMHHAQESALLRKINGAPASYALKPVLPATKESEKTQKLSLFNRVFGMLHDLMIYPGAINFFLILSVLELSSGNILFRKSALIFIALGSFLVSINIIAKKIKNNDPDKQFAKLFHSVS